MQDVNDIILNCASTHWGDRKEGMMALQEFLRGSHMLTGSELKRVTEIFTKMFMDAHTKVCISRSLQIEVVSSQNPLLLFKLGY